LQSMIDHPAAVEISETASDAPSYLSLAKLQGKRELRLTIKMDPHAVFIPSPDSYAQEPAHGVDQSFAALMRTGKKKKNVLQRTRSIRAYGPMDPDNYKEASYARRSMSVEP